MDDEADGIFYLLPCPARQSSSHAAPAAVAAAAPAALHDGDWQMVSSWSVNELMGLQDWCMVATMSSSIVPCATVAIEEGEGPLEHRQVPVRGEDCTH